MLANPSAVLLKGWRMKQRAKSATWLAAAVLFVASCQGGGGKTIGERWFEALNRRDRGGLARLLSPSAAYLDPASPRPLSGQAFLGALEIIWRQWPQQEYIVRRVVQQGHVIAVEWQARQSDAGGRTVRLAGVTVMTESGGRLIDVRNYYSQVPTFTTAERGALAPRE